jgi:hypothetical protein
MKPTLKISALRPDIEDYRKALKSDYTKETLRSVLSLLWKLIAESANPSTFEWQKVLAYPPKAAAKRGLNQHIIAQIRQASEVLRDDRIPAIPATIPNIRSDNLVTQAEQVCAYLSLQLLARLTGETEMFADLQSLLFLCAVEELLPNLKKRNFLTEHDCLVNALFVHTILVWRENPSHLCYLQSVLMDYLEQYSSMLDLRRQSLRLTDVEDHSYLTKAQALWSDLMDLGKHKDAYSLLLDLIRYSPQSYQPEIEDMLAATVRMTNASRK